VDDLEWEHGPWFVKGDREKGQTIQASAFAAHGSLELPEGVEGHLNASDVYNPPNLTYPFGAYIAVVDVDKGTGHVKVRRFIAVDDCGPRINPMIVEGHVPHRVGDAPQGRRRRRGDLRRRRARAWARTRGRGCVQDTTRSSPKCGRTAAPPEAGRSATCCDLSPS
jgi:hypothetical protein